MQLLSVLAQYSLIQNRIDVLLQSDDVTAANLSFLFRQARELRTALLEAKAHTHEEAAAKLACIVNLMQREANHQRLDPEFAALLEAARDTCMDAPTPNDTPPTPHRKTVASTGGSVFGGSVADYVTFAQGRVALIDTSYRFVATSEDNARFYGRQQVGLMGRHLSSMIGSARFETRAKARLDSCFAGDQQSYHYAVPVREEARIMRCDMKPVNSSDGGIIGALAYMTDVTEQARKLRPAHEMNIRPLSRQTS